MTEDLRRFVGWTAKGHYFISTTGPVTAGNTAVREKWRQLKTGLQKELIVVPQPFLLEKYYEACAVVNQQNRSGQNVLRLEKKEVNVWSRRTKILFLQ